MIHAYSSLRVCVSGLMLEAEEDTDVLKYDVSLCFKSTLGCLRAWQPATAFPGTGFSVSSLCVTSGTTVIPGTIVELDISGP